MKTLLKTKHYKAVIRWHCGIDCKGGFNPVIVSVKIESCLIKMNGRTYSPDIITKSGSIEMRKALLKIEPKEIEFINNRVNIIF